MSRDHSKSLFELSSNNKLIAIDDPFHLVEFNLENKFFQDANHTKTAMRTIANLISDISQEIKNDAEIVLVGLDNGGLLLPGVASGLRANDFSIVGYIFVNSPIPGAIEPNDINFEFFKTLPLLSDWPDAPVFYLWDSNLRVDGAKEAELRGWQVINQVTTEVIEEAANSLFF